MITLTPLAGSSSSLSPTSTSPACYLLELDDVRILLDMGGYDPRDAMDRGVEYESKIRELSPTIDLVLLSHSPSHYLSLYPYARTYWGLRCPVYATQPTLEMGRVVCLEEAGDWRGERKVDDEEEDKEREGEDGGDFHQLDTKDDGADRKTDSTNKPLQPPFICTPSQISSSFSHIKPIRYSQPIHLPGSLSHLLLTPYESGHTLGGTIFKLRSPTSGTVLYAIGMNHAGERGLDGTVLLGGGNGMKEGLQRPDLFITEGSRSLIKGVKQKDKASALLDLITTTLRSSRSLLFPIDSSPRLLELLLLLDAHWSYQLSQSGSNAQGWNYPLCLVSRTAGEMITLARSLMEWFGGSVVDDEGKKTKRQRETRNPLGFRHLKLFGTVGEMMEAFPADRPKCVLAVPMTLSYGPSRRLFTTIAEEEGSVIVLTGRSETNTLGQTLFERWNNAQDKEERYGEGRVGSVRRLDGVMGVELDSKVPLKGEELVAFEEKEREEKEKEANYRMDQVRGLGPEADDLSDDDESIDSDDGGDEGKDDVMMMNGGIGGGGGGVGAGGGGGGGVTGSGNAFLDSEDIRTTSFDIYVKYQQTRSTGFFRSGNVGLQDRYRMFPFVDRGGRGRLVDVYGEAVDVGAWTRKGREIEEEGESEEVRGAKRRKKEEEEKKEPPEPPSKFISERIEVQLRCLLFYVDMEGLNDGRAIKTIIPSLNPRRMIIVKSYPEATADLLSTCNASSSLTREIYTPAIGETVTIGEHTNSFSVSLSEAVLQGLNGGMGWSKFEDYAIAQVSGRISSTSDSNVPLLDINSTSTPPPLPTSIKMENQIVKIESETRVFSKSTRSLSHRTIRQPLPLPTSLFIGDLRLLSLKSHLSSLGIPSEFVGEGVLICGSGVPTFVAASGGGGGGEVVAVRKGENGVVVEGNVGEEYYRIRDAVYGKFAQVVVM